MSYIRFDRVSKTFRRHTGRALLRSHFATWFQRSPVSDFYALKNVSFEIREGENVAIVGSNGAGKSTLLSLVAGLSIADEGSVSVNGRVAALLELGSGFSPDLTGAENIMLNAALLGLTRKKAQEAFEPIVDFSGLSEFIHEPLRTYSSGMIMRLAFSVAISIDPDFLIIDEVIAVGDQAFQTKCFEKICDLKNAGKGFLCVSHATTLVQKLCDRALWLDHGELMMDGPVGDVIAAYEGRSTVSNIPAADSTS
jgi:ABC-type polysaccharide/polyol phosphate transport system ATPase subunit